MLQNGVCNFKKKKNKRKKLKIDLTGKQFSRLLVISFSHKNQTNNSYWFCKCDCGNESIVRDSDLKSGTTKSCGCLRKQLISERKSIHSMTGTPTYKSWDGMKERCLNSNSKDYKNYGGRGIKICERWLKFETFYEDMGKKPKAKSIDRIDNNGNYEPSNCKWSTWIEQNNNSRNNTILKHNGFNLTVSQWARKLGFPANTLHSRIYRGWTVERVLEQKG